ncbi:MAG: PLDc N-terminal domain-containing protein [Candidatus Sulfobium sp.]|jgi:hypothetical protein
MKGPVLFFLFFCLTVNCIAAEKVYTNSDLRAQSPTYNKYTLPATPQPNGQARGTYEQSQPFSQHNPKTNSYSTSNRAPVRTTTPINTYQARLQAANRIIAEAYARATIYMLLLYGIPFLIGLLCLIDILRSDFAGNNKIIWLLVVLFLPLVGAILYFFMGSDQKVRPEDDEEPVVRLI